MPSYPPDPDPTGRDGDCCETVLRNISGQAMKFSYLMDHGVWLETCEELCVPGDVFAFIKSAHPGIAGRRLVNKLCSDLANGILELVRFPTPSCGTSSSCSI